MQFSESCRNIHRQQKIIAWSRLQGIFVLLLTLGGCIGSSQSATKVCQSVTEALLGFSLPVPEKIAISEQEIRGERIVAHLKFARPADNYPVNVVCVFAADKYAQTNAQHPYSKVPTRMAVNTKQVTEADLLEAIDKSDLGLAYR